MYWLAQWLCQVFPSPDMAASIAVVWISNANKSVSLHSGARLVLKCDQMGSMLLQQWALLFTVGAHLEAACRQQ
jgi:hypothetical protein